jgi:6-phosphogluconolactonase
MSLIFQSRRIAVLLTVLCGMEMCASAAAPAPGWERFYIGTYTTAGSAGIYQSSLNLGTGVLGATNLVAATTAPSFIALTPNRKFLYAVNETANMVSAFSVNATNGFLTFLNSQSSNGGGPAHVAVDHTGRQVIVANYNGGSITMFPIQAGGQLGAFNAHFQDPGASPHAHCTAIDAGNHFAFVCDLGLDQIRAYVLDAAAGTLTTNTAFITSLTTGSGPRHITFDPQYKRAYVICELNSTIVGFNYNSTNGTLAPFQTNSTLPSAIGGNSAGEIAVHPSGKFLYGSNRGYNSIVVYTVNPADGKLTQVQQQPTGKTPRNFAIDPTGAFCIVASQDSNNVALFAINQQTGLLTVTGQNLTLSMPVCILPFIVQPPQPAITLQPATADTFQLSISNTLNVLTYQIYQTPALSTKPVWSLLTNGSPGQTNFKLNYTLPQQFFRVGVLTNY